jgi:hypothetical protein
MIMTKKNIVPKNDKRLLRVATYLTLKEKSKLDELFYLSDYEIYSQFIRNLLLSYLHSQIHSSISIPPVNKEVASDLSENINVLNRLVCTLENISEISIKNNIEANIKLINDALIVIRKVNSTSSIWCDFYRGNLNNKKVIQSLAFAILSGKELAELVQAKNTRLAK